MVHERPYLVENSRDPIQLQDMLLPHVGLELLHAPVALHSKGCKELPADA